MKILKVIVKGYNKVGLVLRIMIGISGDVAMQVVGVGFVIGVIQDSMETALNSSSDVAFAATAEYYHWRKQGKPLPDFLQKRKNRKEKGGE